MFEYQKLESGVRLVTDYMPEALSACLGIWVGAGSSCEDSEVYGISHVIEHMFFKGTKKRSAKKIAEDSDNLGAYLNAFTGKEATCFHIKALSEVFPKASDILFDMMVNSVFDEKELKKELGVITEELHMTEDTPDDWIMDLLAERVFNKSPLQSPVIGTRKSLREMNREKILKYISSFYARDNIVVSAAGNFDKKMLSDKINENFSVFNEKALPKKKQEGFPPKSYANKKRDVGQSHIAFGTSCYSLGSDKYYAQAAVNDILGGAASSRLFQNIREKQGLAYSVFSYPECFSGAGMFTIYAAVSLGKEKAAIEGIANELTNLRKAGISEEELLNVKRRIKSGYIFSREKMQNRMLAMGKNRLLLGRNFTPEDTMKEIDSVSAEDVNEFCALIGNLKNYSGVSISKERLDLKKLVG